MRWFGESWNAIICYEGEHRSTPLDQECAYCGEKFVKSDRGLSVEVSFRLNTNGSDIAHYHLDCFVELLGANVGSLNGSSR